MKATSLALALLAVLGLSACNQEKPATAEPKAEQKTEQKAEQSTEQKSDAQATTGELVIKTATGEQKITANPAPLAVYDMTALQNLTALGVAVQGFPDIKDDRALMLNLKAKDAPATTQIGTLFEPNLEALHGLKPQAVFVGSRMAKNAEELGKIAPTYNLTIDITNVYEASKQQLTDFGKIFGKTAEADKLIADIDKAISDAKTATQGKGNGLAILINGNKMSAYGKNSRYGYLHTAFGIPMADAEVQKEAEHASHGQPITFEYIQKVDPDWLFVLDRTSAVGEEGGVSAEKVLDNPLMRGTKAWKNKQIVYVSPDSYLAFGGYYQWIKDAKIVTDAFNAKPAQPAQ